MLAAFDWHILWQRIFHVDHVFVTALYTTIYIAVAAQVLGVVFGLLAALMRMSKLRVLRWLSGTYVLLFRGTPVLVQIFFTYYGVPLLFSGWNFDPFPRSVGWLFGMSGAAFAGIVALSVNEGAYMREIVRAGIDSIDKGQMEAARSLGMRYGLAMRRVVLPQAARVIVPPLGNEFNNMMKTTSLLYTIGVYELFQDADQTYSSTFKAAEVFVAVAFWYLVLTGVWTLVQARIERRLAPEQRAELTFRERLVEAWSPMTAWARGVR